MRDRSGKFDVTHPFAPHARKRHLYRAFLADDAFVFHALVLAAQALVILDGTENPRAEQAIAFGLEGAVIDGLRLFDLAIRPRQNLFRTRDRDADLVEDLSRHLRAEKIHKFLVHALLQYSVGRSGRISGAADGTDAAYARSSASFAIPLLRRYPRPRHAAAA